MSISNDPCNPNKIYFMSIWLTDGCFRKINEPFRCAYCFYQQSNLRKEYKLPRMMTLKMAERISDEINKGWVSGISFFGGEPLCNWKALVKILILSNDLTLRHVTKKYFGSVFNITTNGVHFTPERLKILAAHNVHINLSFDGTKETQDKWRDGSYDEVMKNKKYLVSYPSLSITKTMADPTTFYEDVKHIKELGFKNMFTNFLDPYGIITYDGYSVEEFKEIYLQTVKDFHGKDGFSMCELNAWKDLQEQNIKGKIFFGCGFIGSGLGVDPEGYYYQCHQGPTLPDTFRIGHVMTGIDKEKEKQLRNVLGPPSCASCIYKRSKCYVNMYHKYGKFGVDPPKTGMIWERAMIDIVQELFKLPKNPWYKCHPPNIEEMRK